ncbi:4Fe-4S cluster-binding domain-containing protein [Sphingomonas colocasiae]|uniref:Radical SAM protein n=1 Tax=Sphingomonas colocasiae TaxID=1848973 RepID=A0ABS7PQH0_9SPHN|nr:4Fe-4S cluster-binding domain-containing protein [Sphingomonas colocasiae]MBY8823219.1 radical SAM protein [Sphingomonas colocasiae]
MRVALSRLHFPVTTLGPGRRVGLWLQGCSIRCPGCISVDTWHQGETHIPVEELIGALAAFADQADGLTVSGGEPFDQPDALARLLQGWRDVSDSAILVFTGHDHAELSDWLAANPGLIDALMTGPFRSDLPQTLALRGSDNQELHILTERGAALAGFERTRDARDHRLDVMFDEAGDAWIAGIPARGDLARLRRLLASAGHAAVTSDSLGAMPA